MGAAGDVARTVPYLAIIGFTVLVSGNVVLLGGVEALISLTTSAAGFKFLASSDAIQFVTFIRSGMSALVAVTITFGVLALLIALMSRGKLREMLCKDATGKSCALRCVKCLIDDCFPRFVTVFSFLLFLLLLLFVIIFTAITIVLLIVQFICTLWNADGGARENLTGLLNEIAAFSDAGAGLQADVDSVDRTCTAFQEDPFQISYLLAGISLAIVGQVLLLMALNSSLAFMSMEKKMNKQKKLGATNDVEAAKKDTTPSSPPRYQTDPSLTA